MVTEKHTSAHKRSVCNLKIIAFAFFSSKFASSIPSPASASANLVASAPNFSIPCLIVKKLPVLFDIFAPFNIKWPLVLMLNGQCSSPKMAAWL